MERSQVEFDALSTARYAFTNGHPPKGYGAWSFGLCRTEAGAWTEFRYTGQYSQAKKAAMREARSLGCSLVVVNA